MSELDPAFTCNRLGNLLGGGGEPNHRLTPPPPWVSLLGKIAWSSEG